MRGSWSRNGRGDVAFLVLLGMLACRGSQPANNASEDPDSPAQPGLVTSLEVEVQADSVRFVLHVTNSGSQPRTLEFGSAQRYDFAVRTPTGEDIWRWSSDRAFAQVLGSETIAAGASLQYSATWRPSNRRGSFVAIGELTSMPRIEESTRFEIP